MSVRHIEKTVNGKKVKYELRDQTPVFYADTIFEVNVGIPNTRLTFLSTLPPGYLDRDEGGNTSDVKTSVVSVVLPTHGLLDFCVRVAKEMPQNQDGVTAFFEGYSQDFFKPFEITSASDNSDKPA